MFWQLQYFVRHQMCMRPGRGGALQVRTKCAEINSAVPRDAEAQGVGRMKDKRRRLPRVSAHLLHPFHPQATACTPGRRGMPGVHTARWRWRWRFWTRQSAGDRLFCVFEMHQLGAGATPPNLQGENAPFQYERVHNHTVFAPRARKRAAGTHGEERRRVVCGTSPSPHESMAGIM